jgi:hypothetical protein
MPGTQRRAPSAPALSGPSTQRPQHSVAPAPSAAQHSVAPALSGPGTQWPRAEHPAPPTPDTGTGHPVPPTPAPSTQHPAPSTGHRAPGTERPAPGRSEHRVLAHDGRRDTAVHSRPTRPQIPPCTFRRTHPRGTVGTCRSPAPPRGPSPSWAACSSCSPVRWPHGPPPERPTARDPRRRPCAADPKTSTGGRSTARPGSRGRSSPRPRRTPAGTAAWISPPPRARPYGPPGRAW